MGRAKGIPELAAVASASRVPVRVPGFDSFSCRLNEMTGFAKTENMYKRGAGMLACDPPVTQIRYGGEHQC